MRDEQGTNFYSSLIASLCCFLAAVRLRLRGFTATTMIEP